jgi:hypothetical protein
MIGHEIAVFAIGMVALATVGGIPIRIVVNQITTTAAAPMSTTILTITHVALYAPVATEAAIGMIGPVAA